MSDMRRLTKLNQTGLSSLFFTLIMMMVISIIVLGFAQLSRRGQRESLDNQLSSQAYYAAESGVNDVVNAIQSPGGDTWSPSDATNCTDYGTSNNLHPTLSTDNNVAYTCLMVDESAQASLIYNTVSRAQSQIVPINPTGNITGLTISWNQPTGATGSVTDCDNLGTIDKLPTQSSYNCPFPMLRIDILPRPAGSFTASQLQLSTMTVFAKPLNGLAGGSVGFNANGPRLVGASCTGATCSVTITGLGSSKYILHMSSLYADPSLVTVAPATGSAGKLAGAQAVVDATGRAQDVLRRVRVRVPLGDSNSPAGAAIVSNSSVCKRFTADSRPSSYADRTDGHNCL